jgi:site-specific DNA recombinase
MSKRAVIYARVSTKEQADKGASLITQTNDCQAYAAKHGFKVVASYSEDFTGTVLERPKFSQALKLFRDGAADALIVWSQDRLSRNHTNFLILRDTLEQIDVELHYVDSGKARTGFDGLLTDSIKSLLAHGERNKIIERAVANKNTKAVLGQLRSVMPHPPYGIVMGVDSYEIDPLHSGVITRIYQLYVTGHMSLRAIANKLNDEGVPTPGSAKLWQITTIRKILTNTVYIGHYFYGRTRVVKKTQEAAPKDQWIRVECPELAFIEPDIFEAAQKRLRKNKENSRRNAKHPYLMQGHIRCGHCGYVVRIAKFTNGNRYYRCSNGFHNPNCEYNAVPVRQNLVDQQVWMWLVQLVTNQDRINEAFDNMQEKASKVLIPAQERMETVSRLIEKEEHLLMRMARNSFTIESGPYLDAVRKNIRESEATIQMLKEERTELQGRLDGLDVLPESRRAVLEFSSLIRNNIGDSSFEIMRYFIDVMDVQVKTFFEPVGEYKNGMKTYRKWMEVSCSIKPDIDTIPLDAEDEIYVHPVSSK